jgi:HAD superfamily hydrolase (TIGR01549 family)
MTLRAVLFDVGGPLDLEDISERLIDRHIREALLAEGIAVTDEQHERANRHAVESFAWNAYQAIIWRLTGGDVDISRRAYATVAARAGERQAARGGFELRPGIPALLESLSARDLRLGLAANQPVDVIARLDGQGIGRFFHHREVSASHGYRKPDVRLFLRACADLGVAPEECVMVGDRIDNDIAPARRLGMQAVLFRTGRHRHQQPRTWEEVPDAVVEDVPALGRALFRLIGEAG